MYKLKIKMNDFKFFLHLITDCLRKNIIMAIAGISFNSQISPGAQEIYSAEKVQKV